MVKSMETIVNLCKARGYIYPGSEIYGGLANTWHYGPLGVELKNNIKKMWMKKFIQENKYNVGLDSAIFILLFTVSALFFGSKSFVSPFFTLFIKLSISLLILIKRF